jgi:hypothetical protein
MRADFFCQRLTIWGFILFSILIWEVLKYISGKAIKMMEGDDDKKKVEKKVENNK